MAGKVLICDDAVFMRRVLSDIVKAEGLEVVGEAGNGKEAVIAYNQLQPDLVLMDITMPEMDGITALKAIKSIDAGANVVMCSAMGQKEMVIEAISNGAKDFIVKPFENDKAAEVIRKCH